MWTSETADSTTETAFPFAKHMRVRRRLYPTPWTERSVDTLPLACSQFQTFTFRCTDKFDPNFELDTDSESFSKVSTNFKLKLDTKTEDVDTDTNFELGADINFIDTSPADTAHAPYTDSTRPDTYAKFFETLNWTTREL